MGKKGQADRSILIRALDNHKSELEVCTIQTSHVLDGEYTALMKLPIALYYRPMFKELGILSENFY